jgi:deoxyribodipyrimidine photo-lyase
VTSVSRAHSVPELRVRALNDRPERARGDHVLYWCVAARRGPWNFALERAVERARALDVPLIVLEALRCDYPWASERFQAFVIDGIRDDAAWYGERGVAFHGYVEPEPGAGKGLLAALATRARLVVTDDFPCFFLPRMTAAAARKLEVRLEAVDSNGLLPLRATHDELASALAFRRFLQRHLPEHLAHFPCRDALEDAKGPRGEVPAEVARHWPAVGERVDFARMRVDRRVAPTSARGGSVAARRRLREFLDRKLVDYDELRNEPARDVASGLSPYLHFGHVSAHEVFAELAEREGWSSRSLGPSARGLKEGWWGMSKPAEAFLDQLVTWRELGFAFCARRPGDYDRYESLPDWARATLEEHASDPREHVYSLDELEAASTDDEVWNAAQRQLLREGRIHGYLRMLWGKKLLEWSATPRDAFAAAVELNERHALDGRDPNSYSGISWCFGRFDRPWPERAVFGKVRAMTSASTARKLDLEPYLRRYAPERSSTRTPRG